MQGLSQVVTPILWQQPLTGMFKINWDVSVDKGHGRIEIGFIVRGHDGRILAACSKTRNYLVEHTIVEALAAL